MKPGILGTENLNAMLREALNPVADERLKKHPFRPGDKVMQIINNYEKEVFNGDIGVVEAANGETRASRSACTMRPAYCLEKRREIRWKRKDRRVVGT